MLDRNTALLLDYKGGRDKRAPSGAISDPLRHMNPRPLRDGLAAGFDRFTELNLWGDSINLT